MQSLVKQKGLSAFGWLVVIFLFGIALTIAYAMIPAYYDNTLVADGLKSIGSSPDVKTMSREQAIGKLQSYFDLNGVRGEPTKSIKVVRRSEGILVNIDYEVRENIFGNVDVVMRFENQLDTSNPDACCKPLIADEEK